MTQINHKETNGQVTLEQELKLKKAGLVALSTVLKSLVNWIEKDNIKFKEVTNSTTITEENNVDDDDSIITDDKNTSMVVEETTEEKKENGNNESMAQKLEKLRNMKKIMSQGLKLFKQKPEKALKFFKENELLEGETPNDIAKFFQKYNDELDKDSIGDYLG